MHARCNVSMLTLARLLLLPLLASLPPLPPRALQLEDIKQFRQWDSRTPGHPENFLTPGVEVTTGAPPPPAAAAMGAAPSVAGVKPTGGHSGGLCACAARHLQTAFS